MISRAFVAVVPPAEVLEAIDRRMARVGERGVGIRWSRRDQRHVTLQFLGRVADPEAVIAALHEVGNRVAPFEVQLHGAGAFPTARRASVVWLGIGEGEVALGGLAAAVQRATGALGFAVEDRPFHPHVTVARLPSPRPVDGLLELLVGDPIGPVWPLDHVVVFESDTRPDGAVHTELARIPLGGTGPDADAPGA